MNDIFNLRRFVLLFRKTIFERPVQLLGVIGLTLVIDFVLYIVSRFLNFEWDVIQNMTFIFGFVGGGCFLASYVFNYFSSNYSGTSYLTLPASTFEKWLCAVLLVGILYPVIFLAFYRTIDIFFVWQLRRSLNPAGPNYHELFGYIKVLPFNGFVAIKTFIMFLNFTGAMLAGSLYFNKSVFIKVALITCGLYIFGHLINQFIAVLLFEKVDKALPYYCVFIPVQGEYGKVLLPKLASDIVDICLIYIMPGILWLVTLIRLKEKEF